MKLIKWLFNVRDVSWVIDGDHIYELSTGPGEFTDGLAWKAFSAVKRDRVMCGRK